MSIQCKCSVTIPHKRPIKPKLHLNIPHMKSRTLSRRYINRWKSKRKKTKKTGLRICFTLNMTRLRNPTHRQQIMQPKETHF